MVSLVNSAICFSYSGLACSVKYRQIYGNKQWPLHMFIFMLYHFDAVVSGKLLLINPRCACTARFNVVVLCVCVHYSTTHFRSVCLLSHTQQATQVKYFCEIFTDSKDTYSTTVICTVSHFQPCKVCTCAMWIWHCSPDNFWLWSTDARAEASSILASTGSEALIFQLNSLAARYSQMAEWNRYPAWLGCSNCRGGMVSSFSVYCRQTQTFSSPDPLQQVVYFDCISLPCHMGQCKKSNELLYHYFLSLMHSLMKECSRIVHKGVTKMYKVTSSQKVSHSWLVLCNQIR